MTNEEAEAARKSAKYATNATGPAVPPEPHSMDEDRDQFALSTADGEPVPPAL